MSIKITPDKYPQIIEVYNTEGKTAAYDLMRSCYEIKNPTCVMKRMKADKFSHFVSSFYRMLPLQVISVL